MRQKGAIVLISILLLVAAAAAQTEGGGTESVQMNLNQTRELNASIENPLSSTDTIRINFTGGAIDQSLVRLTVREQNGIECTDNYLSCDVSDIPGKSSKQMQIRLEASSVGQEALIMEGKSLTTQQTAEDSISVAVDPITSQGVFSSPGITLEYLFLIAAFGTGFYFFRLKR